MMKVNNLRPLLAGQSPETPRDVTEANLAVYFGSKTFISYLLPKERLLINGIPYKPLNSNIPLIMKTNDITAIFTDVVIQNETCSGLLSVGTLYPVKRPTYAYNIEIYGEDFNSLERHIVRHLERIVDKAFGEVSLYIYVDEKLPPTTMDRLMSRYGAQNYAIQKSKSGKELTVRRVLFEDKDKSGQIFSRY